MWEIIFVIIAFIILIVTVIIVNKSDQKFRDKSLKITKGMDEKQVMEIMEEDPLSIEELKDGAYEWIYEKKQWKGWGMMTIKIEVIFDDSKHVISVERSKEIRQENR